MSRLAGMTARWCGWGIRRNRLDVHGDHTSMPRSWKP